MDSEITAAVSAYVSTKYLTIASLSMVLYDYALTFDAEVELVWDRSWSFGKALFLQNRYFGIFSLIFLTTMRFMRPLSFEFCQHFIWWQLASEVIAIGSAEIILILRVHAVYDAHRGLLFLLTAFLMGTVLSCVIITVGGKPTPQTTLMEITSLSGCQYSQRPPHLFLTWIPTLILEILLMSLMMYKGWIVYKNKAGSKLLQLIVKDSLFYFSIMFLTLLANCMVFALPGLKNEDVTSWAVAIPCAVSSRLLLNMRERYFKERTVVLSLDTLAYIQS